MQSLLHPLSFAEVTFQINSVNFLLGGIYGTKNVWYGVSGKNAND